MSRTSTSLLTSRKSAAMVSASGTALDEYDRTMADSRNCVKVRRSASVIVCL
jgi:hypothetical protein